MPLSKLPLIFALLTGFSIPISSAITNVSLLLTLFSLLFTGELQRDNLSQMWQHPLARSGLYLFLLMIIASFYSDTDLSHAGGQLKKYLIFLYLPLFLLIFQDEKYQRWGLYAFLGAMGLTLFLSYLTAWGLFQYKGSIDNPFVFKQHIAQNILMALSVYLFWFIGKKSGYLRYLTALLALLALINVFMVQGRSGYIILFALLILFAYQLWRWQGLLLGVLVAGLLSISAYQFSDTLHHRIQETQAQLADYKNHKIDNSLAIRLQFQHYSMVLLQQHLWFGAGTGSFSQQYAQLANEKNLLPTDNPHNEYLLIANQLGLFGLSFLLFFFYQMWRLRQKTQHYQHLASALTLTLVLGCGFNSMLLDFTESYAFIYLLGIVYARLNQPKH